MRDQDRVGRMFKVQPGRNVPGCICPLHNHDIQLLPKLSFIKILLGNRKKCIGAQNHVLHASYTFSTLLLKYN